MDFAACIHKGALTERNLLCFIKPKQQQQIFTQMFFCWLNSVIAKGQIGVLIVVSSEVMTKCLALLPVPT